MLLAERHRIDRHDPRFAAIDRTAFASKNLYNSTMYEARQHFFMTERVLSYESLYALVKGRPEFATLPRKVAQWVVKQVAAAWGSFVAARAAYAADPSRFLGKPCLPGYLDKDGRNVLTYTNQAISRAALRRGEVVPSGLGIIVKTARRAARQVRIVPAATHYTVEVVYEQPEAPAVEPTWNAAVDLGVTNLAVLVSDRPGFVPLLVPGGQVKAINQFYNQQRARLQSRLPAGRKTSRQLEAVTDARNRRIDALLHVASRRVIDQLMAAGIGRLVIGHNSEWKQQVNLGKKVNQEFVSIPHRRLVEQLVYKARMAGITVLVAEEAYTSRCSFLDLEPVERRETYLGRRIHRGLFRSSTGRLINADCNGAYNTLRKHVASESFTLNEVGDVIAGGMLPVVVHPVRLPLDGVRAKQGARRESPDFATAI